MNRIRKGDRVIVISGEDRGKEGIVLKTDHARGRSIVEGVNFVKHHQRATQKSPQAGIVEKEAPIHNSNLLVVCSKCSAGVRTKIIQLADGEKVRACKICGEMITGSS